MIPVARPDIGEEEIEAVAEVLRSGMIAQGRRVAELEERWAEFVGVRHAIAVANGTLALMAIYAALDLGPGDEVITVSHSFNATGSAVLSTGATPVFIDIEPDTYNMDADRIEAAITPRTKAICPVHLFGLPADLRAITEIAERHGLVLVEDACQSHGATFEGRKTGSFGHGAFSLYGTKNMTTGEGGFITTDDDRVADWIRLYRNQGMRERYHHEILGYNFRLTDIVTPIIPAGRTHVFHQYTVGVGDERDDVVADLTAAGIGTGIFYPIPVHRQRYIVERGIRADLPETDRAARRSLSLPMYPGLSEADQATVVDAVRAAVAKHRIPEETAAR